MKISKHFFIVLTFIGFISFSVKAADVSLVNFESPTTIGTLSGGNLWTGSSSSLYVGANPQTSGINTTAQAGYAIRTTSQTGGTFQAEFNVLTQNYNGVKYFHIMVYKPKQSKMELRGRQQTPDAGYFTYSDRFTAKAYYTDIENQWVDVVFKYDFTTSNLRIDRFVLSLDMIAPGTRYSGNTNIYFDEIIVNDEPQPRGRTVDYSAKQLPESFEGTTTIMDKTYFGIYNYWTNGGINNETATEAIVANPAKNNVNQTNNALRMMYRSTFWWDNWLQVELNQGAGMTVGASNKYLHVMVNKNANAEFAIKTRVGSTESGWVRATAPDYAKANGWQDLVIEIPSGNYGLINRLSINGHTTGPGASDLPVYIDEIEFSGTATPRTIFNVAKTYDFGAQAINGTYTYSLPITAGALLNGDLTVSMSGSSDFSTTTSTLTQAQVTAGTTINLTYIPTTLGAKTGTLSIMSNGVTLAQVGIAGTGGSPNEAINVDFESGSFFATTPANTMNGGVGDALTIIDNPSKTGLNTSNKVALGVRSASGTATFQAEFNIEPTVVNTTRYLHVFVYKPTHASMTLYGRNNYPVSGNSWDNVYSANHMYYTKLTNEWVDVVFAITGNGSKIDRLVLGLDNFSPAGRYASNANFYFDQILLNDDPNPRGATLPTKKTTFPEDFEGSSYVGDPTYFPTTYSWITNGSHANSAIAYESVVANPLKDNVNNSANVFKTTQTATNSTWWTRIQFELNNGLGITVGAGNKYFHVMMYKTGSGGEEKAFFIRTDNAQQEWINPTAVYVYAGWQDMVFEVPAAVYGDIKKIAILPYGGNATDVDVYFDNIEFSADVNPRKIFTVASTYDFGTKPSNVANTYSLPITAGTLLNTNLTVSISGSSDFTTTTTTLTQAQLNAGATIDLTFTPTSQAAKTATLSILSNGVVLKQVELTGTGGFGITASANNGTMGSVSGTGNFASGASVSLSATANTNYRFVNWTESSTIVSTANPYTFSASANRTLVANFDNAAIAVSDVVNSSTFANCATCNLTVANGATLVVDESKTLGAISVAPGGKLTNASGKTLTANTLTLSSDVTGTATFVDNGTTNVTTATVEQYLPQGRNWYVSSPITTGTNLNLSTGTSVVSYNEATGNWDTESGALTAGKGYISVSSSGSGTSNVSFAGTLNTGTVSVALTRKGATKTGFNLVGNPFPSYLNAMAAINANANLVPTIWYRTKGASYTFETVNTTSGVGTNTAGTGTVTGYVPPMQAFWVRTNVDNQTLTFTNAMRFHANPVVGQTTVLTTPMKARTQVAQPVLRLQVSNGTNTDETVLYVDPNASDSYDAYDSPKMSNANSSIPEIYTTAGSEQLVINGLNGISPNLEIPLGFNAGQANSFSLKATEMKNFEATTRVFLKDKVMNALHELTPENPYSFSSDITNTTSRFSLIFRVNGNSTNLIDTKDSDINVYATDNRRIAVNLNYEFYNGKVDVSVRNLIGEELFTTQIQANKTIIPYLFDAAGVYLVSISYKDKSITKKVVLQ